MVNRICFDIETELFPDALRGEHDPVRRLALMPLMRVACTFDGKDWRYFLPLQAKELINQLMGADELISYNGLAYDELVLRRHYKLKGRLPRKGKHIDLCAEIERCLGYKVKLDKMARLTLGKPKLVDGRQMIDLDIEALKTACRSDVCQTYRLWELWAKDKLEIPVPTPRRASMDPNHGEQFGGVGPGHHGPTDCPFCKATNSLEILDEDREEMSEGQEAEYDAGLHGCSICTKCGKVMDWEGPY